MALTAHQMADRIYNLAAGLLKKRDFQDFAMIAKKKRQENIDGGLDIDGNPFEPLKESTIKRKKRKHVKDPEKILVEKGVLRNPKITVSDTDAVLEVPKSRETISQVHQDGNSHVPQRKHWGITVQAQDEITKLFNTKINQIIRRIMRG